MARNEINSFVTPLRLKENQIINANKLQSTNRNEPSIKRALGDIKNFYQTGDSDSLSDGKLGKETINEEQLSLMKTITSASNKCNNIYADDYYDDQFSSEPANHLKAWADKLALNDEEIDRVLASGFTRYDDDDMKPAVPSPEPYEDLAYVSLYELDPEPENSSLPPFSCSDEMEGIECDLDENEDSFFEFSNIIDDDDEIGTPFIQRLRF